MFRFTIRDVLWLTVVVALGIGWWLSYRHWSESDRSLAADRGVWLRRAVYLKAMLNSLDKKEMYQVD
jgi:hypothetical protein